MLKTLLCSILSVFFLSLPFAVSAQGKAFSAEELSQFDGMDGRKAYYAYEGKVYDVTGSSFWKEGQHYGLQAGQDLTGKMGGAPHGTEVFASFQVMGTFGTGDTEANLKKPVPLLASSAAVPTIERPEKVWYEGRIRPFGISILGWTGIALGILFVFTFLTCFAMPWAKMNLPWKGSKIGPDALDGAGTHLPFSSVHKYFVWWTVIFGIVHGILGFLQLIGIYL